MNNYFKKLLEFLKSLFSTNIDLDPSFEFSKVDFKKDIANLEVDKLAKLDGQKNLPHPDRKALDATEERFDALYLMDIQECEHGGTDPEYILTGSVQEISVTNTADLLQDSNQKNIDSHVEVNPPNPLHK